MHTRNENNIQIAEITTSKIMSFKCSNRYKIVFGHLRLTFNAANRVLMCAIGIKLASRAVCVLRLTFNAANRVLMCAIGIRLKFASRAVCVHGFRKGPGCALIGAFAHIRMNMVFSFNTMTSSPITLPSNL